MSSGYTPVPYAYREAVEEAIRQKTSGRIFYFDSGQQLECADGRILHLSETVHTGWNVLLDSGTEIPLHRIITLYGKPGPAYDEYDAYSIRCGECRDED